MGLNEVERQKRRARAARRRRADPEWHERRKQQMRESAFRRKYGLDPEQYQEMFLAREGLCDICGQPETRTRNGKLLPLCVDHDEESGLVRGLLCSNCNVGIGHLNHDIDRLRQAIRYLRRS